MMGAAFPLAHYPHDGRCIRHELVAVAAGLAALDHQRRRLPPRRRTPAPAQELPDYLHISEMLQSTLFWVSAPDRSSPKITIRSSIIDMFNDVLLPNWLKRLSWYKIKRKNASRNRIAIARALIKDDSKLSRCHAWVRMKGFCPSFGFSPSLPNMMKIKTLKQ